MLEIRNNFIPFNGFGAMNILGVLFVRGSYKVTNEVYCHEAIHTQQQYEILAVAAVLSLVLCNLYSSWWYLLGVFVLPIVVYLLGFLAEVFAPPYHNAQKLLNEKSIPLHKRILEWFKKVWIDAYRDNCFEREACMNEHNPMYLAHRVPFAWVAYIIKGKDRKRK